MRTFELDKFADTPTPVTRSDVGKEARNDLPTDIRRRLVLLSSASLIALMIAVLPVQFDPETLLPNLSVAHADNGGGQGGDGGSGSGGGNGDGGHGGGNDNGAGDGDRDQDQDQVRDRIDIPDQDRDRDRLRDQLRDGEAMTTDQALQYRERARFRNGFAAGEGFPEDTPDVGDLTPVSPEEETGLVGSWTETTP